jgi:hypothetical protein
LRQQCHLAAPFTDGRFVEAAAFVGDQARANLDHDAASISQYSGREGLAHDVLVNKRFENFKHGVYYGGGSSTKRGSM